MHRSLSSQKTENLQFLASPRPELRLEYILNFGIIHEKVEIPKKPNKIEHIKKIEISYENPVKVEQIKKNDETQTYEIIKPKSKNKIEQANKVQIYEKSKKKIKPKIDNITYWINYSTSKKNFFLTIKFRTKLSNHPRKSGKNLNRGGGIIFPK